MMMTEHEATLRAIPTPPLRLLRGWKAISAYCGLSPQHLRQYAKNEGLPVVRWGRHAVLMPEALSVWLLSRTKYQDARRAERQVKQFGNGVASSSR